MTQGILVSIVIVNYNGRHLLETCLDSVLTQTYQNKEVFLVDNGSTDGSVEFLKEHYPQAQLMVNDRNLGFSSAVNQGIQASKGEFVAVLNNDTKVAPSWIGSLVTVIQENPRIGSCASKQLDFYRPDVIDSAGILLARGGYAFGRGHGEQDRGQFDAVVEVFGAAGASAFYRRRMLEEIGLFDDDYFAYNEEFDLSLRAQLYGWKCLYAPSAVIYHMGGESRAKHDQKFLIYYMECNRLLTIIKNYPAAMFFYFLPYLLKYELDIFYRLLLRFEIQPIVARVDVLRMLPRMLKKRTKIQRERSISDQEFKKLVEGRRQ